jgi:hypothetical protein
VDLVALEGSLTALEAVNPRKNQIIELLWRMTVEETVEVLKITVDHGHA